MFAMPEAGEVVLEYLKLGWSLCEDERVLCLANAEECLPYFLEHHSFPSFEFQEKMFAAEKADKLVRIYVEKASYLASQLEIKLFDLPNAREVIEIYISRNHLSFEAQAKLFALWVEAEEKLACKEDAFM